MATANSEKIENIMQHAQCDKATAKAWLKFHNGNWVRAIADAKDDAVMQKKNRESNARFGDAWHNMMSGRSV